MAKTLVPKQRRFVGAAFDPLSVMMDESVAAIVGETASVLTAVSVAREGAIGTVISGVLAETPPANAAEWGAALDPTPACLLSVGAGGAKLTSWDLGTGLDELFDGKTSAEEFEDDFEKEQDDGKETIVVCYCTIGYRSQKKVQELSKRLARSRPDVKAYNLSGSIVAWTHETDAPKLLDPKTGKETNRVHTYGKTWALQSVEYESVVYKRPVFEAVKGFFFKKKKK